MHPACGFDSDEVYGCVYRRAWRAEALFDIRRVLLEGWEVKNRVSELGKDAKEKEQDDFALFQKFFEWKRKQ